jgi:hypothetical protein
MKIKYLKKYLSNWDDETEVSYFSYQSKNTSRPGYGKTSDTYDIDIKFSDNPYENEINDMDLEE